jgi:hypothetical protein
MADINYLNYASLGLIIPSGIPFFPVFSGSGDDAKVKFNQGYVFDYQAASSDGVKKIKVDGMDAEFNAKEDSDFCVEITTGPDTAKVNSAILKKEKASSSDSFHFSAKGLDGEDTAYTNGEGVFRIPLGKIVNGSIKEIYLRENIHWQKINFESLDGSETQDDRNSSANVLANYGTDTSFGDSPTVKFKKLLTDDDMIVLIKKAGDGKNIQITTRIPNPPVGLQSILHWNKDSQAFNWLSADESKVQVLVNVKGTLQWKDGPSTAGEGPQIFSSDGDDFQWLDTEECDPPPSTP